MSPKPVTDYVYDSAEMLADPDAVFDRIRTDGDVVWCPSVKRWLVLSKSAALAALKNEDLKVYGPFAAFSYIADKTGEDFDNLARICEWIPFLHDGEHHRQLRSLYSRVLSDIRDDYLGAIGSASARLLAIMLAKGGGDFAKEYGDRLHVEAISALAGFPEDSLQRIARNSSTRGIIDLAASVGEMKEANQRIGVLIECITQLVSKPPHSPFVAAIGGNLSAVGIADNLINRVEFLTALTLLGRDTLAGTMTVGLAYLLDSHNGVLVSDDWKDLAGMEDEIIRLSSIVQMVNRIATRPVKLDGVDIAVGEQMLIFLPAANRDPASFACPHAHSADNGDNIAFGASRHLCAGKALSRSVVRTSMKHLAALDFIGSLPGRVLCDSKTARKYDSFPIQMKERDHDQRQNNPDYP